MSLMSTLQDGTWSQGGIKKGMLNFTESTRNNKLAYHISYQY